MTKKTKDKTKPVLDPGREAAASHRGEVRVDALLRAAASVPGHELVGLQAVGSTSGTGSSFGVMRRRLTEGDQLRHIYLDEPESVEPADNRFEWWFRTPPASGVISATSTLQPHTFVRHFHSAIATVAGDSRAALSTVAASEPWKRIDWRNQDGSPNAVASADYLVREDGTGTLAFRFRDHRVDLAPGSTSSRTIVVSEQSGTLRYGPIRIDFLEPQRAVGLQAGYLSFDETLNQDGLNEQSFELVAFDTAGEVLESPSGDLIARGGPRSTGSIAGTDEWKPRTSYLIGVNDQEGRIASVEFRCVDPNIAAIESLFILAVWYEPLPPAVVLQGVIRNGPDDFLHANHPDREHASFGEGQPGQVRVFDERATFSLPFRCDEAVAFLRGFGVGLPYDGLPQKVAFVSAGVGLSRESADRITVSGRASLESGETPDPLPISSNVYFTLVAWRKSAIDATASKLTVNRTLSPGVTALSIEHRNPRAAAAPSSPHPPELQFGPIFTAPSGVGLRLPRPCEIQRLMLPGLWSFAQEGGSDLLSVRLSSGAGIYANVGPAVLGKPQGLPRYVQGGQKIAVPFVCDLKDTIDSDEEARATAVIEVINGPSVDAILALPDMPVRPEQPKRLFGASPFNVTTLNPDRLPVDENAKPDNHTILTEVRSDAEDRGAPELLAVGAQSFVFEPQDEMKDMDAEVYGISYGRDPRLPSGSDEPNTAGFVGLAIGSGIDIFSDDRAVTSPAEYAAVNPSSPANEDESLAPADPRLAMAIPGLLGLTRRSLKPRIAFSTAGIVFKPVVGIPAVAPTAIGRLRSDSNVPVTIAGLVTDQYTAAAYRPVMIHSSASGRPRRTYTGLDQISVSEPLILFPGETITFGGSYFSESESPMDGQLSLLGVQGPGFPSGPMGPFVPFLAIFQQPNPYATVQPTTLTFWANHQSRAFLLSSLGTTPLVVSSMQLDQNANVFTVTPRNAPSANPPWQIESSDVMEFVVSRTSTSTGVQQGEVILETNAGTLSVAIVAGI